MIAGLASTSALLVGPATRAPVARVQTITMAENILATAESLQGPEIFWGPDGVPLGHDESDIKGYDSFGKFTAAVKDAGIDLTKGEYTVLAPADSAFEKHAETGGKITADILKYHVIPGKKSLDALNTNQKTLQGGELTAYRKFRKNWLDNAIIGLKSEGPSKSSNWPADVECSNGVIHAIDTVLVPGAFEER